MPRIYADIPKFKRVHHALTESVRLQDMAVREIDKALSGRRTEEEKKILRRLRKTCRAIKEKQLDAIQAFREDLL